MAIYCVEVCFMCVLSYWYGIDFFGDILFYIEDQVIGFIVFIQFSCWEVFNFIVNEFNEIESDMFEVGIVFYGCVDKGVFWML